MRTSASQFQLLVEFMERNGDLSKPTEGPQGRMTNVQLWSQLTNMLNADATGDTKTVDKWRKDPPSRIEISEVEVQESTDAVPRKEILKGVNGRFTSGQLIAIMGPSGAGKSSLLNALSGYRSAGVEGELLVNGQPRDEHLFQRSSCYITQEDLLQPLLTVREAMYVAARLKAPKGGKMLAEKILEKFSLSDEQTIDTKTDMLSGGQKKRLSIALELVNNPPVFFLDEPTSGLDTVTSTQCVEVLKQIAREGRTVVCTIHQPAASLFEMFDQVYVMADGLCVYQGDTSAMVPFLESVGLPCPRHHNPADFIIEMTEHQEHIKLLCDEMKNGLAFKSAKVDETPKESINNQIELKICYENPDSQETQIILSNQKCSYKVSKFNGTSGSVSSSSSQIFTGDTSLEWMKMSDSREYATTYCEQFLILLQRMMKQLYRNRQGLSIQFIHHVMCGLLIGVCFWNMANDGAQMFNHLKLCVGLIIFFAYTQIMVPVLVYPQEVKLVKKEHFNCWYSLTPYYAALTVSKLPLQILFNIIFSTIVFFMVGIPFTVPRFSAFCLVGNVVSLAAEGMGMAIGSVFSVTNGCAIGPSAIAPFLGLGIYGFDFAHEIPLLMNLLMKTSFIRCGIVAMVLTIFGFNRQPLECKEMYCHFAKPDVLMKYLDIEHSSIWIEIGMIMAIMIVFRSMCYIGLRWRFAT